MWAGVPIIDCKYPNRAGTNDKFFYLRDLATAFGYTTIRLELSVAYAQKYNQTPWGTPGTMAELLAESSMDAVVGDAAIERVQFSMFSLAYPQNNPWAYHWYKSAADLLEQEFYDACVFLRDQYAGTGKEFILSNWEGDWQLLNGMTRFFPVPYLRVRTYRDWHRRRLRAMRKAIADTSGDVTLRYALEANRVRDLYSLRLIPDVLPFIPFDPSDCLVSLSHYEAIEGWTEGINTTSALQADIVTKMTAIFNRVREFAPVGTPIIIGEYAWPALAPYFAPIGFDMIALHGTVYDTALALGCEGINYWQLCDNEEYPPPGSGQPLGFNIYNRNGNASTVGGLTDAGTFWATKV